MPVVADRPRIEPGQRFYRPRGAARDLWAYHGAEVLMAGPAGTGKSRACLEKLHACAHTFPGMRGLIVRKTRESLTQSALVTFEERVLPQGSPIRLHHESQEYRYPNGSKIMVAGLDKDSKIMSTEFDLIYAQEATELLENDWGALTTRLRNNVMPYQQILADCNPAGPQHWLKVRADSGRTLMLESRHEDNPTVTAAYLSKLDALTGYQYKRLRLGLWVAAEGMYFTEWNPDIHVIPARDLPADWPRWTATDWGWADPFCTLWAARDPNPPRQIYIYREVYASGLRDEQQAKLLHDRSVGERIVKRVGDPSMFNNRTESERPSIATVYKANGWEIERADNNRIAGWQTVRRALATENGRPPRLQVMRERCLNLLRTLPTMVHDQLDPEDMADKVNKQKTEDHAEDALRYLLQAENGMDAAKNLAGMFGPVTLGVDAGRQSVPMLDKARPFDGRGR